MKLYRSFLAILLIPTLLLGDINPPRINGGGDSKTSSTVTVIVHVEFVDPPISNEMTIEEIETTSEGMCSENPEEPTEIICQ